MTYADQSSVCLAAIHAGIIKDDEGGLFGIEFNTDTKNYKSK